MTDNSNTEKPVLLRAIEAILARPDEIRREVNGLKKQRMGLFPGETEESCRQGVVAKIIQKRVYLTGFVGGASGLASVVPGLSQILAATGGATADVALTMKFQIEMTMAIAVAHGHDIANEEIRNVCFIVAGVGAINELAKKGGREVGTKAFIAVVQRYLRGGTLVAVKEIFRRVGITFTRKALQKAIPFGVGAVIGLGFNAGLTSYIGSRADDFFSAPEATAVIN